MKAHLTKVSLALLSAAFLLGCQDQGSGVVGPDGLSPQFAKGGKPGPPDDDDASGGARDVNFQTTVRRLGGLIGDPQAVINRIGSSTTHVVYNNGTNNNYTLDLSFLTELPDLSNNTGWCFPLDGDSKFVVETQQFSLEQAKKNGPSEAVVAVFFTAKGGTEATRTDDVNYLMVWFGDFEMDRPWLPTGEGVESNTLTLTDYTIEFKGNVGSTSCATTGGLKPLGGNITALVERVS